MTGGIQPTPDIYLPLAATGSDQWQHADYLQVRRINCWLMCQSQKHIRNERLLFGSKIGESKDCYGSKPAG